MVTAAIEVSQTGHRLDYAALCVSLRSAKRSKRPLQTLQRPIRFKGLNALREPLSGARTMTGFEPFFCRSRRRRAYRIPRSRPSKCACGDAAKPSRRSHLAGHGPNLEFEYKVAQKAGPITKAPNLLYGTCRDEYRRWSLLGAGLPRRCWTNQITTAAPLPRTQLNPS